MMRGSNKARGVVSATLAVILIATVSILVSCSGGSGSKSAETNVASSLQSASTRSSQAELREYFDRTDPLIEQAISLMNDSFASYEAGLAEQHDSDSDALLKLEQRTGSSYSDATPYDASECSFQLALCVQNASLASSHLGGALRTDPSHADTIEFHIQQAEKARAEAQEAYAAYMAAADPLRG